MKKRTLQATLAVMTVVTLASLSAAPLVTAGSGNGARLDAKIEQVDNDPRWKVELGIRFFVPAAHLSTAEVHLEWPDGTTEVCHVGTQTCSHASGFDNVRPKDGGREGEVDGERVMPNPCGQSVTVSLVGAGPAQQTTLGPIRCPR